MELSTLAITPGSLVVTLRYIRYKKAGSDFTWIDKFNMDEAPGNEFFLEYIARPQTAEIFF